MPIFARRRLQAMLDELQLAREKSIAMLNCLESKRLDQALPAEMELAVVWAINKLGPTEIEPAWYSSKESLPDAFSESLIPGHETIIDVAALSDAALPGDQGMRNASRKISHDAGKVKRGAGNHLSFYFFEETVPVGRERIRRICTPVNLQITDYIHRALKNWISSDPSDGDRIRLKEGRLDVVITWNAQRQSAYNFQTSMSPEIRSLRENYIYRKLREKGDQLANPMFGGLKCVILADVGSTALRYATKTDNLGYTYNGAQIASEFLRSERLDVISIITPTRSRRSILSLGESNAWEQLLLVRPGLTIRTDGFEAMLASLPKPRFEGYQARQLHEQGVFAPTHRGMYMGTNIKSTKGEKTEIHFSARALLDVLGGRCSPELFLRRVGLDEHNAFKYHLEKGETIHSIALKPGGVDEDDDQIVVEFRDDPAARPLQIKDSI